MCPSGLRKDPQAKVERPNEEVAAVTMNNKNQSALLNQTRGLSAQCVVDAPINKEEVQRRGRWCSSNANNVHCAKVVIAKEARDVKVKDNNNN